MDRMPIPLKTSVEFMCAVMCAAVSRLTWKRRPRVVLFYHGVDRAYVESFRQQMAYLARECLVLKPCDISSVNNEGHQTIVALTFDDAYVSFLENAVPILREYGLPAALFVPTGNMGRRPGWAMPPGCPDKDETVMGEQQIVALDKEGFEILSHTVSHQVLTDLNDVDLETELTKSKQALESLLGHEVLAVSYPHGAYDARVLRAARRAGYTFGFTIYPNIVDNCADPLRIGRFEVFPRDSLAVFKLKANGAYQVTRSLINLKRLIGQTTHRS